MSKWCCSYIWNKAIPANLLCTFLWKQKPSQLIRNLWQCESLTPYREKKAHIFGKAGEKEAVGIVIYFYISQSNKMMTYVVSSGFLITLYTGGQTSNLCTKPSDFLLPKHRIRHTHRHFLSCQYNQSLSTLWKHFLRRAFLCYIKLWINLQKIKFKQCCLVFLLILWSRRRLQIFRWYISDQFCIKRCRRDVLVSKKNYF